MSEAVLSEGRTQARIRPKISRDDKAMRVLMVGIGLFLVVAVLLPLYAMLSKSVQNKDGVFIGVTNYAEYFSTPALFFSIYNSLTIAAVSTVIVVTVAFTYAYALTRTCMPFKPFFRAVALVPILAPSLLAALSLIYWFGNQGVLKGLLLGETIYGPIGVVIGSCFWTFRMP